MKVEVIYDKYNTKIEKATLLFGDTPETNQSIVLDVIKKDISENPEVEIFVDTVKITSTDADGIEIANEIDKEDLRTFMSLLRNLLVQIK